MNSPTVVTRRRGGLLRWAAVPAVSVVLAATGLTAGIAWRAAAAAAHPTAYVANHDADTVSAIDTVTHTTVASIPAGDSPQGVAIAPDGEHVYFIKSRRAS